MEQKAFYGRKAIKASPLESWDCNDETVPFMWLHERHG